MKSPFLQIALIASLIILSLAFGLDFLAYAADQKKEQLPKVTNAIGMEFVLVPAGKFMMGSPENERHYRRDEVLHEVTITRPFYLQVTEVTQRQWEMVMKYNPSAGKGLGLDLPVERVSWQDCQNFIVELSQMEKGNNIYRLPTEAEWEYACRAGTTSPYWWGNKIDCKMAMFANNDRTGPDKCMPEVTKRNLPPDAPAPAKSYPPNSWGFYEMPGNVWEWCQDWYGKYKKGPQIDPKGPAEGYMKVRRGGSFFKYGWYCRSANRNMANPLSRYQTLGFRLVMEQNM